MSSHTAFGNYLIGTGNEFKVTEYSTILGRPIRWKRLQLPEPTMQPTYWSRMANNQYLSVAQDVGEEKARKAYALNGNTPIAVEAVLFFIRRLAGFPGPYIGDLDSPEARSMLSRHTHAMRPENEDDYAAALGVLSVYSPEHGVQHRCGYVEGTVPIIPRGEKGFGWDSLFAPNDSDETYAEMGHGRKCLISMRRLIVNQLRLNPLK